MEQTKCRGFACLPGMRKTGTWSIINGCTGRVGHVMLTAAVIGRGFYSEGKGKLLQGFKWEVVYTDLRFGYPNSVAVQKMNLERDLDIRYCHTIELNWMPTNFLDPLHKTESRPPPLLQSLVGKARGHAGMLGVRWMKPGDLAGGLAPGWA